MFEMRFQNFPVQLKVFAVEKETGLVACYGVKRNRYSILAAVQLPVNQWRRRAQPKSAVPAHAIGWRS